MKRTIRKLLCFFGFHALKKDRHPVNGIWWAFCNHCPARYGGEYDMANGETHWRPM